MADARGTLHNYHGKKLLITYHPAALLRNPNLKKLVWEDVKQLRSLYDEFLENK
jgi:DNA polymerase